MTSPDYWHGKPYYSLDAYCKNSYGEKLYKIALNAGFTCPNRDGSLGTKGCIFCSKGGSGDFASSFSDISASSPCEAEQIFEEAYQNSISFLSGKKTGQRYIIYFQAYTNTYGPVAYLEKIYRLALSRTDCAGISIATRPDCLPDPVIKLLARLKEEYSPKFIWVELGLQSIHEHSASFIRRGYPLSCFDMALDKLYSAGVLVVVHLILGLPGESLTDMLQTINYLNHKPVWGAKLQLLHILKDTDLEQYWRQDPDFYGSFQTLSLYLEALISCLEHLRPDMVIHRITGDAPRPLLLAPLWSAHKRHVLNSIHKQMKEQGSYQGRYYNDGKITVDGLCETRSNIL